MQAICKEPFTLANFTPHGRTLEGNGITPDKTVTVIRMDLQSGRDATLEEAEKYLLSLSNKRIAKDR